MKHIKVKKCVRMRDMKKGAIIEELKGVLYVLIRKEYKPSYNAAQIH